MPASTIKEILCLHLEKYEMEFNVIAVWHSILGWRIIFGFYLFIKVDQMYSVNYFNVFSGSESTICETKDITNTTSIRYRNNDVQGLFF